MYNLYGLVLAMQPGTLFVTGVLQEGSVWSKTSKFAESVFLIISSPMTSGSEDSFTILVASPLSLSSAVSWHLKNRTRLLPCRWNICIKAELHGLMPSTCSLIKTQEGQDVAHRSFPPWTTVAAKYLGIERCGS